jgi:hypothetical protein
MRPAFLGHYTLPADLDRSLVGRHDKDTAFPHQVCHVPSAIAQKTLPAAADASRWQPRDPPFGRGHDRQ